MRVSLGRLIVIVVFALAIIVLYSSNKVSFAGGNSGDDGNTSWASGSDVNCGECDGKVTDLMLRYNGVIVDADIEVVQKKDDDIVFMDMDMQPGETFTFSGTDKNGTLSTEIRIYVNGDLNTSIHTSCSKPIGPGLVRGDFEVVEGYSLNGGFLCAANDDDDSGGGQKKKPKKDWKTSGNENIDPDNYFLGTTDSADLVIKTDNDEKMRVTTDGDVGIGTDSPTGTLHVEGGSADGETDGKDITLNAQDGGPAGGAGGNIFLIPGASGDGFAPYGKVIVGTDESILTLDVNGIIRIRGGSPFAGGVLTSDSDGIASWMMVSDPDSTNELNTDVSLSGTTLEVTDAGGTLSADLSSLVDDADADPTNELQDLTGASLTNTTLQIDIEAGTSASVDLSSLQDDINTDDQTLSLDGTDLSIEDGNSVDLSGIGGDNLGDHTAIQNISLMNFWLSGDGGNEGISVDNSGNVGIGTTDPEERLTVAGNIVPSVNDEFSLGTANKVWKDVYVGNNSLNIGGLTLSNVGGTLSWDNKPLGIWSLNGTSAYYNDGNVGIGTMSPGEKLDVNGKVVIDDTASPAWLTMYGTADRTTNFEKLLFQFAGGDFVIKSQSQGNRPLRPLTLNANVIKFQNPGNNELMRINSNGNVGIGTTSPGEKLDVNGKVVIDDTAAPAWLTMYGTPDRTTNFEKLLFQFAGGDFVLKSTSQGTGVTLRPLTLNANTIKFQNPGNNELMRINSNGNVGIGTISPGGLLGLKNANTYLDVDGSNNLTFTDGITGTKTLADLASAGTVTIVDSGDGLTGGPIFTSGTISIATGGVTNAMLASPTVTVNAGPGLLGGGTFDLGGNTTIELGVVDIQNGGTGITTTPTTSGQFLRSSGPDQWSVDFINAGDLPDLSSIYVNLSSSQTIGGQKTFTSDIITLAGIIGDGSSITNIDPTNIVPGTAAIGITGNAATATTAINFTGSLIGDVTGTQGSTNVVGLQGNSISTATPNVGDVLQWTGTEWGLDPVGGSLTGSGAATRLAFWTDASTLGSNADLFWDDTNNRLGIGTISPGGLLGLKNSNVYIDVDASDNLTFTDGVTTTKTLAELASGGLWNTATGGIHYSAGNVGIGTASPSDRLEVSKSGASSWFARFTNTNTSGGYGCGIEFYDGWAGGLVTSQILSQPHSFGGGWLFFNVPDLGNVMRNRMTITPEGNIGIGTKWANKEKLNVDAGNVGIDVGLTGTANKDYGGATRGVLALGSYGTPPTAYMKDSVMIYAKNTLGTPPLYNAELFVMDEQGNETKISPHDSVTGEWIFYSKNVKTGRVVRVNMEKLVKKIEELTGEKLLEEWIE